MPEARAFGRRAASTVPPAIENETTRFDRRSTSATLDAFGRRLGIAGELVGFGGLLLYLISSIVSQAVQIDTSISKVYIPPSLQGAIDLTSPAIQLVDQSLVPVAPALASALIGVVGTIAMLRRRYLLGGLSAAVLFFPWWAFGAYLPFVGIWASILLGVGCLRFFEPKGMALALSIVLGLVVGLPMVGLAAMFTEKMVWPSGRPSVSYAVVAGTDLDPSKGRPALDVARLPDDTSRRIVDRAFVLAQLATIQHDAASVVANLAVIDASSTRLNNFEEWRLDVASNFAAHAGALGPAAKARTDNIASMIDGTSLSIGIFGILLGVFGPFAGLVADRVTRRSHRIEAAEAQLAARRARPANPETTRAFGRIPSSQPMQSFAASDATLVVSKMSKRIDFYGVAVLALGVIAVLATIASFLMRLPPAESNTAFDTVDLNTAGGTWALSKGLPLIIGMPPLETLLVPWLLGGLLVASITYRAKKALGAAVLGVVLAGLVYWQVNSLFFIGHPHYAERPGAFTQELRAELEAAAAWHIPAETPQMSAAEMHRLTQLQREAPDLPTGAAAFILAQLDYLDGNASDIPRQLARVAQDHNSRSDATTAEDQRLDLIQEWATTQGVLVAAQPKLRLMVPMGWVRASAQPLLLIGAASGALSLLALALSTFATRRSARLEELLAERNAS